MKRIADQSLYEVLDVRDDASADEISAACARAQALYGPGSLATYTLMSAEEAGLLARRIDEARATLLDAEARARYDESRRRAAEVRAAAGGGAASLAAAPRLPEPRPFDDVGGLPPYVPPPDDEGPSFAPEPEPTPMPRPIRLEREISPPPPEAVGTPVPLVPAPPAPPPVVPEGGSWSGDVLRRLREARGISLPQIAERTKVTRHHIENIEAERFGQLPAPVYLRGILLALARELRLDGQKVARSYLERAGAAKGR